MPRKLPAQMIYIQKNLRLRYIVNSIHGLAPNFTKRLLMTRIILFIALLLLPAPLLALDFTLHQQQGVQAGPTLLVVGGIQGDEPGGFNAAALLATRYRIEQGNLWVVPNLNFPSIIKRSRGLHGDMNRKFSDLPKDDPEYHQVARMQKIIADPQVDLVFNLHDGSGFYHPQYIDKLHNPNRWGQSCIIDQKELPGVRFGNLEELSKTTIDRVNSKALKTEHQLRLKNTHTRISETEMRQTLTFFSVKQNKPAVGIEASKSFPTHIRTYYHLLAMEAYMEQVGVRFSRDFELTPQAVKQALNKDLSVSFADGRIKLELENLRPILKYFPLQKNHAVEFDANNPLIAVVPNRNRYRIHYGNNRLSFLKPQYFEYDQSLAGIEMQIDGVSRQVAFGATIPVSREFLVQKLKGYRVNIIGFSKRGRRNESGLKIKEKQIAQRYSIDKGGKIFRVEVYRQNRFSGMVLVDFRTQESKKEPLVAQATLAKNQALQNN